VASYLVSRGVGTETTTGDKLHHDGGKTPLLLACGCDGDRADLVGMLLEKEAGPTVATWLDKTTPLVVTSRRGNRQCVECLLSHGSGKTTVDHLDKNGSTALLEAAKNGRVDVVRILIEASADPVLKGTESRIAVDYAREGNHGEIVEMLEVSKAREGVVVPCSPVPSCWGVSVTKQC